MKLQFPKRKLQIGVIGGEEKNLSSSKKAKILEIAKKLGEEIAKNNAILLTGGMSGVMKAASQGAYENGGITVGTPGRTRGTSNPWVIVEICTPIDIGDYLFAGIPSCDVIIVLPGGLGTLAEMLIASRYQKPLIFIKKLDFNIPKSIKLNNKFIVDSAEEAVRMAIKLANKK